MSKFKNGFRRITKQKSKDTQPTGDEYKAPEAQTSNQNRPRRPWIIVLDLTLLYLLSFPFLNVVIGPVAAALISIPVASAGWFFGIRIGLIASLFGIVLSSLLLYIYSGFVWSDLINGWPGFAAVIVFAYVAGYLHDESVVQKRMSDEITSRERFIALISIATRNILNTEDLNDAYYRLVSHLTNLFIADYAYLIRWDGTKNQAILVAATNSLEQPFSPVTLKPEEASIVMATLQTERPQVIEDVQSSTYIINPAPFKDLAFRTKSALIIPLSTKDYCFGVATFAFDAPRRFAAEEIVYVELAADQITLALRTIHQQLEIETQLQEAKTLANIERALSESERIGVDKVLQLIVDSAKGLIPKAKNVTLHLIDDEKQILVPRAVAGYREKTKVRLNMRLGEGIAGTVMSTGEVINISDVQTDHRFLNQTIPVKFRSLVVAPIRSKEQCIGTISIQSDSANAFDAGEVTLLETLGTQVSIGIDNAYLLESTQQNLKEINILYRISQDLAGSLDPDQLMKDVAELLQQNFGYHHVMIYVVDDENGNLVARQGSGKVATHLVTQEYRVPVGKGIIGHVAITGKPFLTNDVEGVLFYFHHPDLADVKSELTVPITIDDQVIGILDVQQTSSHLFTKRQLDLLVAVADQLAVALQKANLYNNLQSSLAQEKAMRTKLIRNERLAIAGQLLASVSHELNNPLQAIQNVLFLLEQDENLSLQGEQDLKIILSEVERMSTLLNRLRTTYRPIRLDEIDEIQLNEIVEDIHSLTSTHMRHNEITFEFHPDPELPTILGVSDQIRQVVLNLFINAIEAMQTGGHLTVCTQKYPKGEQALLTITDTGDGIDPEILPKIFEPFFTTKKTGTGLGLSITSDIIHQHSGDIQVENNQQGGTIFKVWFPVEKVG
jgi:signal transduction histidine kinase